MKKTYFVLLILIIISCKNEKNNIKNELDENLLVEDNIIINEFHLSNRYYLQNDQIMLFFNKNEMTYSIIIDGMFWEDTDHKMVDGKYYFSDTLNLIPYKIYYENENISFKNIPEVFKNEMNMKYIIINRGLFYSHGITGNGVVFVGNPLNIE